jgi:hypothetical protein
MFGIAVGLTMGSYWLFHWGYYFAKGAPISLLDDILPSRRPTFLAAIDYMRQAGPFSSTGALATTQQAGPTVAYANAPSQVTAGGLPATTQQEILGAQVAG